MHNPQTDATRMTPKVCRYCRSWYLSPLGSRWQGCRDCCPTLEDGTLAPPSFVVRPAPAQNRLGVPY